MERVTYLPDKPLGLDTEFAFIEGQPFVNAAKHEQVVARHVAEIEALRKALDVALDALVKEDA